MTQSFWIILLAVLSYGAVHSLLASMKAKALARRWLGNTADRWYRISYNIIAVLALLPILLLIAILQDKTLYRIPFPWVILTLGIQVIALLVIIAGVRQTGVMSFVGISQLFQPAAPTPSTLVTGGLYRNVRHPLYSAGLVIIWLLPVMTWNLLALNIGLTIYILVGANIEERKLMREYGQVYNEYRQHTPMLVPGFPPLFRK